MEYAEYIPLGSVVRLKGGLQKLLIIARALNVRKDEKEYFFDYGAVTYPEGLTGDQMVYFNHEQLEKIVFEGFRDEDDEVIVRNIHEYIISHPNLVKGSIDTWRV